jgi:hypothetical protein
MVLFLVVGCVQNVCYFGKIVDEGEIVSQKSNNRYKPSYYDDDYGQSTSDVSYQESEEVVDGDTVSADLTEEEELNSRPPMEDYYPF